MRAGALRHDIEIQHTTATIHPSTNERILTWVTFRTVSADVFVPRGREFAEGSQRVAETTTRFRVRIEDMDGVKPTMRILFGGSLFQITNILPDYSSRQYATIEAVGGASAA